MYSGEPSPPGAALALEVTRRRSMVVMAMAATKVVLVIMAAARSCQEVARPLQWSTMVGGLVADPCPHPHPSYTELFRRVCLGSSAATASLWRRLRTMRWGRPRVLLVASMRLRWRMAG